MNDSIAENVYEDIVNKTLQDTSKQNESFSQFKGSIEVNMFNSKFNNMNSIQQNKYKLTLNDDLNFTKLSNSVVKDQKNDIPRNIISSHRKGSKIVKKKYEKNMSLDMVNTSSNKFLNQIENIPSDKKNIKSVRSKKFLIPLDPNLYKVDMEEVKKKLAETKTNRSMRRNNSSRQLYDNIKLINITSKSEERTKFKENNKEEEIDNENKLNKEDTNPMETNSTLLENIKYLKSISEDKELHSKGKDDDKNKELSVIIEKKEQSIENNNSKSSEISKINEKKEEIKSETVGLNLKKEEKLKNEQNTKAKGKTPSIKIKEINKTKKINLPYLKIKDEKDLKINSKIENKMFSKTPSKKTNTSKLNILIKDKKSPEKDKKEIKGEDNNMNTIAKRVNITPNTITSNSSSDLATFNNNLSTDSNQKQILDNKAITKSFKSSLSDKDENEALFCFYCIKKLNSPILLSCKHKICYECAMEIHYLNEFFKMEVIST